MIIGSIQSATAVPRDMNGQLQGVGIGGVGVGGGGELEGEISASSRRIGPERFNSKKSGSGNSTPPSIVGNQRKE